jgi:hypothetical protein
MNVLATILPGVRELRTPLTTGYLLLASLWLYWAYGPEDSSINFVSQPLERAVQDWGKAPIIAAASVTAYLMGATFQSFIEITVLNVARNLVTILIGLLRYPLHPIVLAYVTIRMKVDREYFPPAHLPYSVTAPTEEKLEDILTQHERMAVLDSTPSFLARILVAETIQNWQQLAAPFLLLGQAQKDAYIVEVMRNQTRDMEATKRTVGRLNYTQTAVAANAFTTHYPVYIPTIRKLRIEACRYTGDTEKIKLELIDMSDGELLSDHDLPLALAKGFGLDRQLESELKELPAKLVDKSQSAFDRWDRLRAEAEFRRTMAFALSTATSIVCQTSIIPWAALFISIPVAVVLLADSSRKQLEATIQLVQTLMAGIVVARRPMLKLPDADQAQPQAAP